MYWLKQVKYVESIYLDKEPTEQIPLPNMEPKQFSKGKLSFTGVPLSLLAPLVGKQLWWVQSSDGLERVITEHQLENWILTEQRELINLTRKLVAGLKTYYGFVEKGVYLAVITFSVFGRKHSGKTTMCQELVNVLSKKAPWVTRSALIPPLSWISTCKWHTKPCGQ